MQMERTEGRTPDRRFLANAFSRRRDHRRSVSLIQQRTLHCCRDIVLGLAAALALSRVLKTLLFEVNPTDPLTFAVIPLLLAGVAFFACVIPARRAASGDPLVALRNECPDK